MTGRLTGLRASSARALAGRRPSYARSRPAKICLQGKPGEMQNTSFPFRKPQTNLDGGSGLVLFRVLEQRYAIRAPDSGSVYGELSVVCKDTVAT